MKTISVGTIIDAVAKLSQETNFSLPDDVRAAIERGAAGETSDNGIAVFDQIRENAAVAEKKKLALCQDTGIADIFVTLGQEVQIAGGTLADAINTGVAQGYRDGFLRKSIVRDPLRRENTGDNIPANISLDLVPGDGLSITLLPKGGGSENASMLAMLTPSAGWQGVRDFVLDAVRAKGINACPPLVIGVGIGGDFSSVARLAKKALLRSLDAPSPDPFYAEKEKELLDAVNATGIGPMGLGGTVTALGIHINAAPCHIASLPVAVSMQCHSCRRKTIIL